MPSRAAKRQKLQFDHRTPSPDSDEAESPTRANILFRNTTLASPGGSRKAYTNYLPAHGSPSTSRRNRDEVVWNDEAPTSAPASATVKEVEAAEYPFLDPAYLHQCNMDNPDHKRRRTNASVSFKSLNMIYSTDLRYNTI